MASATMPLYDAERAQTSSGSSHGADGRPKLSNRTSSGWRVLEGAKKLERSYDEFDTRNASQDHLVYADGDTPKNKVSKLYHFLLNVSIVTRWILFIVPVLGILWIPGILSITTFPKATVWSVKLLWWSIWLSVAWGGWWAALAICRIAPTIIRSTLGVVAVGTRRYIEWMAALHRYIALFAWSLVIWIAWKPLIKSQQVNPGKKSVDAVNLIEKILFAIFLCSAVLLFEKFSIQWIAGKFHERSYAERIADQKHAVRSLVTLYRHSSEIPGKTIDSPTAEDRSFANPKHIFKKIRRGVRKAATTTTTALGNVASEIAGSSVLQPNSPQAIIKTTLESSNKSRALAHRIFFSFAKRGSEFLLVDDIARFFPSREEALHVFSLFDKDGNGDASLEEVEMSMMDFHREQLSIENSMRDLDSAVGRLDNIFMSLYVVIACLIIAVALEAQLLTLITGAGTLVLGLSWLIGGSLQEVLTSIIFLFIKHPFDVGDRVIINGQSYTVKEIRLLSTTFLDANSTSVQAPNISLNTLFIQNMRRSPSMSETFAFDVSYGTNFEDLEKLREVMLKFLTAERRDYHANFDVNILNIPDQDKMSLNVDIKYKSNAQLGSLRSKRRNKWICALKAALAECKIFGPKGDPNSAPGVTRYTEVPWDTILAEDTKAAWEKAQLERQQAANPDHLKGSWKLADKDAVMSDAALDDVFGTKVTSTPVREVPPAMPSFGTGLPSQAGPYPPSSSYVGMPAPAPSMPMPSSVQQRRGTDEMIEMQPPRRG
ncbi:Mechanosensitive ion channel-domain-containing protein [Coprinopsis sp. MPI-PUGE-AT-0042]|nr:Mechanosensitive ion channel-domain-containing protein [Coprinopsis sp. MPI-PUGE-AT-0042]